MNMTREEAIKSLQNIVEYWTYKPTEVEAAKMAISALRPVSREQVEKIWSGCGFCKSAKYVTGAVSAVAPYDANHEIETAAEGDFDFCPVCGRPLTDEAVDMVMERLEALKDADD